MIDQVCLLLQGAARGAVRPGDLREGEVGGEDGALLQIPHQLRCVMRIETPCRSDIADHTTTDNHL